jgi:hypothetical protein
LGPCLNSKHLKNTTQSEDNKRSLEKSRNVENLAFIFANEALMWLIAYFETLVNLIE